MELRRKTEEVETLKTENKDLKEIIKLKKLVNEKAEDIPGIESEREGCSSEEEQLLHMKRSGFKRYKGIGTKQACKGCSRYNALNQYFV